MADIEHDELDEPLTLAEIHALLWCVRNVDSDALRNGPYRPRRPGVVGHGDLSTATNKIERAGSRLISAVTET